MLTLDTEETTALDYSVVNASIQETFTAIDKFEWQAIDELSLMRDKGYYFDGGHESFEDYCENELTKHGGYRRVRDLLSAKKVVDTLPEELRVKITKPSQTRPLLRLVKTPDKLEQAVAIAAKEKPFPTAADFALAVQKVVPKNTSPTRTSSTKQEKVKTQLCNFATVSSLSHPRYGESGVIEADAPNNYQQIVTFSDGERLLVNNSDLADLNDAIVSESSGRTYPKEYSEAIAAIEERHKQELERLSQEMRIGLQTEATAKAEEQVQEQIQSLQQLFKQQKEENIQLQQRLSEMEGLRKLEAENQQLRQRIQDLENAVEQRPSQQWGNTMTQQATKALNKQVKQALEKTIDLRSLAQEPPKENAQECLRLMGMALKNLASAMNNTQALEAAAIILGSEPTPTAIAYRAEQLEMLPQAVSDIRAVLAKPGCSSQEFWAVAQEYEVIKSDYWAELTTQETELISTLQNASLQPRTIGIGSIVAHADPYRTLYLERGEVVDEVGGKVVVAWDHWRNELKKTQSYSSEELRFWQGENQ
ncbi:hypothetical protein [Nostoc sp. UCD120]|uniref:hypothetical protein n=1 Tax=Nostoc sp. UCD120 TaxID=2681312 RepID=UPI0016261866|nr:hypothetical protein [Nostoc sp. UCD120]MBC1221633.1 hypothetical protein [Nostoc sp. UCD120]